MKTPVRSSAKPLDRRKKMKLRILFILVLLAIVAQKIGAAENWQTTSYEKVEAFFLALDKKEAEILTHYEPKMAEFYAVFTPYHDAERKMMRYVFFKQLKENPKSLDWTDFWNWARGWNIGTKEQEKLATEDPAYMALREDFLVKKEALKRAKELTRMRNAVYEQHSDEFILLEENLLKDLKVLQAEVNKQTSNTPLEPSR
jgi:hypothetical protein